MGELGTCDECGQYANICEDCFKKDRKELIEECAKIADEMDIKYDAYQGTHEQIVYSTQEQIAKAIRKHRD